MPFIDETSNTPQSAPQSAPETAVQQPPSQGDSLPTTNTDMPNSDTTQTQFTIEEIKAKMYGNNEEPVPEETGFVDYVKAYGKINNSIQNVAKMVDDSNVDRTPEPGFNAIQQLKQYRPDLMERANEFIDVPNSQVFATMLYNIDYENRQRAIINQADTTTHILGALAAETLDPLNLFFAVKTLKVASATARISAGAATGAASMVGTGVVQEGLRIAGNENKHLNNIDDLTESTYNVLASGAVGGVFGGIIGALSSPVKQAARIQLASALKGEEEFKFALDPNGKPVGVVANPSKTAAWSELDKEGLAYLNHNFAKIISGPEFLRGLDLRAITSESNTVQKVGDSFFKTAYIKTKNTAGIASDVKASNFIYRHDNVVLNRLSAIENDYLAYLGKGRINAAVTGVPEGKVKLGEINRRLFKSITDPNYIENMPFITKHAKLMKADMSNRLDELIAEGYYKGVPEDKQILEDYLPQRYNQDVLAIPKMQEKYVTKVGHWLETHHADRTVRETPLSEVEGRAKARSYLATIRKEDGGVTLDVVMEDMITKGSFTKERKLLYPTELVAEFLDQDAAKLYKEYMFKSARLLESGKGLKRAGFNSLEEAKAAVLKEGEAAKVGITDEKELQRINRQFADQAKLVETMYRSMLGQLRKPGAADRWFEATLNAQYLTKMGGVLISSMSDPVMIPYKMGLFETFRSGYYPLFRSFKTSQLSKDQWADHIGSMDLECNNIIGSLMGLDDMQNMLSGGSKMERYLFDPLRSATKPYSVAIGINYWTDGWRRQAMQVASAKTIRMLKKFQAKGKLSEKDVTELAQFGIGSYDTTVNGVAKHFTKEEAYKQILNQIDKHVQDHNGSFIANPHLWDDKLALERFGNSIQMRIEDTILRPGVETLPVFAQESLAGKLIFQFKSFSAMATGRILLSALERRDANSLIGVTMLIGMSTLSWIATQKIAGRDISQMSEEEILLHGIERSGFGGLIAGTALSTAIALKNPEQRRYGGKSVGDAILGPTAGTIYGIGEWAAKAGDKDGWTSEDSAALARNLPLANIFYIKGLFNAISPPKQKKKKGKGKSTTNNNPLGDN